MTDAMTVRPPRVSTDGDAGPYIILPESQLDAVRTLLDAHAIKYEVDEDAVSLNGGPFLAILDLEPSCDPAAVQRILDEAA